VLDEVLFTGKVLDIAHESVVRDSQEGVLDARLRVGIEIDMLPWSMALLRRGDGGNVVEPNVLFKHGDGSVPPDGLAVSRN
jgi:hypothetical protein